MTCQALRRLQDRDDDLLVVLGEGADDGGDGRVLDGLGLDPQRSTRARHTRTQLRPPPGAQHGRGRAAGQSADLLDGGNDAVRRVTVGEARGEQQLGVRAGLRR